MYVYSNLVTQIILSTGPVAGPASKSFGDAKEEARKNLGEKFFKCARSAQKINGHFYTEIFKFGLI